MKKVIALIVCVSGSLSLSASQMPQQKTPIEAAAIIIAASKMMVSNDKLEKDIKNKLSDLYHPNTSEERKAQLMSEIDVLNRALGLREELSDEELGKLFQQYAPRAKL